VAVLNKYLKSARGLPSDANTYVTLNATRVIDNAGGSLNGARYKI
jgi:hypothetical protein